MHRLIIAIAAFVSITLAQQGPSVLIGKTINVFNPRPGSPLFVDMSGTGYPMTDAGGNWFTFTVPATVPDHVRDFGIRRDHNGDGVWLSRTGLANGPGTLFDLTTFGGGDSVWFIIDPSGPTTAAPKILIQPPRMVHILNPWRLTAPVLVMPGGARKNMLTVSARCGWFMAYLLEPTETQVHFAEITNAGTYGRMGLGNNQPYDLTAEFNDKGNSLWLDTQLNTWFGAWPNKDDIGGCQYQMAATVRDFAEAHEDFNPGGAGNIGGKGMVNRDLGADSKPVRSAASFPFTTRFPDWFNTTGAAVTGVNKNYETCVDLPMGKTNDGLWEYDSYSNGSPGYFPIEDFANPNNERNQACGGAPNYTQVGTRNMNFCMESHAKFRYRKGQTFSFRGDDDVWVFINKKLVIDLGGIHVALADSVLLDTLGLVEGQEYDWDFFFCERKVCGSSLRIKTSIFFEQVKALEAREVAGKPGTFEIIKREGGTGACGSAGGEVREVPVDKSRIIYKLRGATSTADLENLGEGSFHNGGIIIATPSVVVDTSKITSLPPGNYRVVAYEVATPTIVAEVPFIITNRSWVQFVPKVAPPVTAGTLVPVIAENRIGIAAPTGALPYTFTVSPPAGLLIFNNEAGTLPVAANAGTTGANGLDTVWVGVDPEIAAPMTFTLATTLSTRQVVVTFNPRPIDLPLVTSASIHDDNADGIPDRISAVYDRDIAANRPLRVAYQWPATAAAINVPAADLAGTVVAGTALTLQGEPLITSVQTSGPGTFTSVYPGRGKEETQTFPLADKIAPVLLKAEMVSGTDFDTLRLEFSEPVATGAVTAAGVDLFIYRLSLTGADLRFNPDRVAWNSSGDVASLTFPLDAPEAPRPGNLVRIMDGPGRIADAAGNGAGPNSLLRIITGVNRAEVKTVTYMKIDPTLVTGNEPPITVTLEQGNPKVEEVVSRTGRLGHLIKVDLGDFAQSDGFKQVDPAKVILEYQVSYFTNLGVPVVTEKKSLACTDAVFQGNCRSTRGFLFLGWGFTTQQRQRVATGAYVVKLQYKVTAEGETKVSGGLDQTWGVLRGF